MIQSIVPGELTLRLQESVVPLSVSHVERCPDLGPQCEESIKPIAYNHHVDEVIAETAFDASLAITSYLAIDSRWTLRVVDVSPTYSELSGAPKSVPDDIHHHDETLVDVTDPWLLARFVGATHHFVSLGRLGLSLPIGRTEQDPYRLGREGKRHEHVQAGTGTVVPIVGMGLAYIAGPVTIGLGATGFFNTYANAKGFRAPMRLYANHRVSVGLLKGALTPYLEGTLAHEGEEYWHGLPGLEGSNVRTELHLGAGLGWQFYERWSVEAAASGRVATLTNAHTFKSFGTFSLALSTTFELWRAHADGAANATAEPHAPVIRERRHDGIVEFEKEN